MHLTTRLLLFSLVLWCLLYALATTAAAGMLGYPVPRQRPLHLRFELAGDSFQETLDALDNAKASSGRALLTTVLGLTDWSEIYARFGLAEFNVHRVAYDGDFGFAYGGGARVRLLRLSWGSVGLMGQYMRFRDDDNNNVNRDGTWEEVDVAVGLGSRRFGPFQFYGGGAYHKTELTIHDKSLGTRVKLHSKLTERLFVGVHIYPLTDFPGGQFVVNLEARFIGEIPQVTLGLQYAF
jgi:hypothetical protein